jgi:dolichol-phosphate mannosyltransferase
MTPPRPPDGSSASLSIVIPFYNEENNVRPLLEELREVCQGLRDSAEVVLVNDGSTDATAEEIDRWAREWPAVRAVHFLTNQGQAAALYHGLQLCLGGTIVTLDGDGQNNPHDIPRLLDALEGVDMVAGVRANRQDSRLRLAMSRFANAVRSKILGDGIRDTGCTLKAFRSEVVGSFLPIRTMYSFMAAMAVNAGYRIKQVEVTHRARTRGTSKYGLGAFLWRPLADMLGLLWFFRRRISCRIETRP